MEKKSSIVSELSLQIFSGNLSWNTKDDPGETLAGIFGCIISVRVEALGFFEKIERIQKKKPLNH